VKVALRGERKGGLIGRKRIKEEYT
jgi:hypothetical protein